MIEFLIKRADDAWWDFPYGRRAEVLRPHSIPSKPVQGWGTHRISVEGTEVSFSAEEPGIQVSFETGSLDATRARQIVDDICINIEAQLGQKTRVIEL
jgi:hypothetical protein